MNGAPVTQDTYIEDLTTLFARFGQEWTARWDKHLDTPESFWDPILQFVDTAIPVQDSTPYEPIAPDQLLKRIRPKKPTAATGLDRWSRQEIPHMAPDLLKSDMFAWVEQGNPWPPMVLGGLVHALEKQEHSCQVQYYRLVTVFSLLYRCWSSIGSRQSLQFHTDKVSVKCFGNVPHRTADHYFTDAPMTGCMLDLANAFNHLPRLPIMQVRMKLGLPIPILRGWPAALHQMERRFYIRPPLRSCSGLPGGCGLSVVGMLILINVITDK